MSDNTIVTPELRNASSRSRCSSVAKSNSVMVKVFFDGRNVTSVPRLSWAVPTTASGATASPSWNSMKCASPSRQMVSLSQADSALTTETPTPCRPPETFYEFWSNFPPAGSWVMRPSRAELPHPLDMRAEPGGPGIEPLEHLDCLGVVIGGCSRGRFAGGFGHARGFQTGLPMSFRIACEKHERITFSCTRKRGWIQHKVDAGKILSNRHFSRIRRDDSGARIGAGK